MAAHPSTGPRPTGPPRTFTWLVVPAALALAGCAGPLTAERDARERWRQLDERRDQLNTRPADASHEPSPAADGSLPDEPALADYLQYAIAHHPDAQAAFKRWKAALERVPQARAMMDPQLSYGYVIADMGERQSVELSQVFPWYGRLRASGDAALEEALAAEQRFHDALHAVRERVMQAYAEYAYLARALAVMRENRRILEDLEAAAAARFEAGDAPYADVVRAGVAVEQAGDEIDSLEARRPALAGRLNAALGRSARQPLAWPAPVPRDELAHDPDEARLLDELGDRNPELRALEHEATSRRHAVRLARQNRIPDLMLGVEYMDMREGRDAVELMASINVPIWSGRLDAERAEALAELGAATQARVARQHALEATLREAWYRFRDADRRTALFERTLIPMGRDALEASEAAYAAGTAEFDAVAQAQSALQEMQLTYERAAADRFQALAELERLVGTSLTNDAGRDEASSTDE